MSDEKQIAPHLSELQRCALRDGLSKLFKRSSFSICDFDTLTELAGIHVDGDVRRALRALHCVDYGDMGNDTKKHLADAVLQVFEQPTFDFTRINKIPMLRDSKLLQ